jgi:hypothetical protein
MQECLEMMLKSALRNLCGIIDTKFRSHRSIWTFLQTYSISTIQLVLTMGNTADATSNSGTPCPGAHEFLYRFLVGVRAIYYFYFLCPLFVNFVYSCRFFFLLWVYRLLMSFYLLYTLIKMKKQIPVIPHSRNNSKIKYQNRRKRRNL